jgi:hypothetical protein
MANRNEESHFSKLPTNQLERSKFKIKHTHKTTFNTGRLIPFYVEQDVLPGDTYSVKTSFIIRMTTPIWPTMDNLYADYYYFYIPNRLVWDHWKEFNGENKSGAWEQTTEYEVPMFISPTEGALKGSLMDYMGIPTGVANLQFSKLPIRAYILTWNDWFRDQNLTAPLPNITSDGDSTASNVNPWEGGKIPRVYKLHDYFTSALPEPQKGEAITTPLGLNAPVTLNKNISGSLGMIIKNNQGNFIKGSLEANNNGYFVATGTGGGNAFLDPWPENLQQIGQPPTLIADLTQATAASINALRLAVQTQRILEKDARGGTRYTEVIKSHFGVLSPDARQQRPEYLGGKRVPIQINQTIQTSSTDTTSPQGNTGAYSLTGDTEFTFTKSFTEHGIILGLICIRTDQTYQQGLERGWSRRRRLDFYWPTLAHLGEQPILNKEIYATGTSTDNEVFGYQERWAEYRYKPSRISGELRSTYATPLDSWHYGLKLDALPVLSTQFLQERENNVDRTLQIKSTLQDQFIGDFLIDTTIVRPMPVYSVPGMLDHF